MLVTTSFVIQVMLTKFNSCNDLFGMPTNLLKMLVSLLTLAVEKLFAEAKEKSVKTKDSAKQSMLAKYGGQEHIVKVCFFLSFNIHSCITSFRLFFFCFAFFLVFGLTTLLFLLQDETDQQLLLLQSEHYAEYAEDGRLLKGQEKAIPKSKYIEDTYESNHTSVWGSWYDLDTGKWGFKCCHQMLRNSYCTGDAYKKTPKLIQMSPSSSSVTSSAATTSTPFSAPSSSSSLSSKSSSASASAKFDPSNAPTTNEIENFYKSKNRDVYV